MGEAAGLAVFLPGDLRPVLPHVGVRRGRLGGGVEAEENVSSDLVVLAETASQAARSFDWSLLERDSLEKTCDGEKGDEDQVKVSGVGICSPSREACALMPHHVLPPHRPVYVSTQSACLYIPKAGDFLVGLVTSKGREFYDVNIRSSTDARLAAVAGFEGATRRNRPQLNVGSVLFVQVERVNPLVGADVTCCSAKCAKAWSSEEKVLGELKGGLVFDLPISFALSLMLPEAPLPRLVGAKVPFEMAVGFNGRVWVRAGEAGTTLRIANCFKAAVGAQSLSLLAHVVDLVLK